jgi:hypothetical protein
MMDSPLQRAAPVPTRNENQADVCVGDVRYESLALEECRSWSLSRPPLESDGVAEF